MIIVTPCDPPKVFCKRCAGDGCVACNGFGWKWDDGVTPEKCRDGVACGRVAQCAECPHKDRMQHVGSPCQL